MEIFKMCHFSYILVFAMTFRQIGIDDYLRAALAPGPWLYRVFSHYGQLMDVDTNNGCFMNMV